MRTGSPLHNWKGLCHFQNNFSSCWIIPTWQPVTIHPTSNWARASKMTRKTTAFKINRMSGCVWILIVIVLGMGRLNTLGQKTRRKKKSNNCNIFTRNLSRALNNIYKWPWCIYSPVTDLLQDTTCKAFNCMK